MSAWQILSASYLENLEIETAHLELAPVNHSVLCGLGWYELGIFFLCCKLYSRVPMEEPRIYSGSPRAMISRPARMDLVPLGNGFGLRITA